MRKLTWGLGVCGVFVVAATVWSSWYAARHPTSVIGRVMHGTSHAAAYLTPATGFGPVLAILDKKPPIAGRVVGLKAEHGERRPLMQGRAQPFERCRRNQRRIAKGNDQIVCPPRQSVARGEHGMRRSLAVALNEGLDVRTAAFGLTDDRLVIRSNDHRKRCPLALWRCRQHVRQQ